MPILLRGLAIVLLSAAVSIAAKAETAMGGDDCGKPVKVTAKLVRSLGAPDDAFRGRGKLAPFLLATRVGEFEKVQYLFAKVRGRWRGWIYTTNAPAEAIHVAPRHGMAVMFGMWGVEGPGKEYTVLSTRDGFRSVQCNFLPAPPEPKSTEGLWNNDYMEIIGFSGDARGRAKVLGSILREGAKRPEHYVSFARLGRNWSTPRRSKSRAFATGAFRPLDAWTGAALMRDLRRSAGLRPKRR